MSRLKTQISQIISDIYLRYPPAKAKRRAGQREIDSINIDFYVELMLSWEKELYSKPVLNFTKILVVKHVNVFKNSYKKFNNFTRKFVIYTLG